MTFVLETVTIALMPAASPPGHEQTTMRTANVRLALDIIHVQPWRAMK